MSVDTKVKEEAEAEAKAKAAKEQAEQEKEANEKASLFIGFWTQVSKKQAAANVAAALVDTFFKNETQSRELHMCDQQIALLWSQWTRDRKLYQESKKPSFESRMLLWSMNRDMRDGQAWCERCLRTMATIERQKATIDALTE